MAPHSWLPFIGGTPEKRAEKPPDLAAVPYGAKRVLQCHLDLGVRRAGLFARNGPGLGEFGCGGATHLVDLALHGIAVSPAS